MTPLPEDLPQPGLSGSRLLFDPNIRISPAFRIGGSLFVRNSLHTSLQAVMSDPIGSFAVRLLFSVTRKLDIFPYELFFLVGQRNIAVIPFICTRVFL